MDDLPQQAIYHDIPRDDVAPFIPKEARSALDIGCSGGGFGLTVRRALGDGVRIVGVEAVPSQAAKARQGHGYDEVLVGYFPEAMAGSTDSFDVVFFNDVLEHVLDPGRLLEEVHSHLSPTGVVVASIPSIQYAPVLRALLAGRWDYADSGTLDRTHVRFFTRATMIELFEQRGFVVERCEGINSATVLDWQKRTLRRRLWLRVFPDSEWVQFVVVARPRRKVD